MPPSRLLALAVLAAPVLGAACGGDDRPPPKVAHESAGAQVKRVAVRWGDTVVEDGFLENDPNGVLQLHVVTTRTLSLGNGGAVSMRVERDETFQTKSGTSRCKAKGEVAGSATYEWRSGEAEVRLSLSPGELPRTCETPGFPVLVKALG